MTQFVRTIFLITGFTFLLGTVNSFAEDLQSNRNEVKKNESFNTGKFVVEDVSDAFEWHIATFGHTDISIPLPIILYSKDKGWNFFMSSRFEHGKAVYNGFRIEEEGKNAGKIVELDSNGTVIGLPIDLSITKTVAGVFVSVIVMLLIFLNIGKTAKRRANEAPTGLQNLFEPVIIFIRDEVARPAIGEERFERYLPFLLTLFFFILINSLLGLVPIFPFGANVTGNIAVTMVLAIFTFIITTISTNKLYWKEIYNPEVPWWLKFPIPLMPIVELTGVFTKPFVLMIRLFANMLAGHLIVAVFISLIFVFSALMGAGAGYGISVISVAFSVFMVLLDVLVSFIQAYVFVLLSALYFGMAAPEHH